METKVSQYKRQKDTLPMEQGDTLAITDLILQSTKNRGGRPAHYPNDEKGLQMFIQNSIHYFEYLQDCNESLEDKVLIADIEAWAVYLGITRATILSYAKRNEQWQEVIDYYKGAICSLKKQLALRGKIPSVIAVFDLANNHQYKNTSEYKLNDSENNTGENHAITASQLPKLEET